MKKEIPKPNVLKDLTTMLFYPAVLGYFIFLLLQNDTFLEKVKQNFAIDPFLAIAKGILIIETIIFYCCDFLGSLYVREYTRWIFISDIVILVTLIVSFDALGLKEGFADPNIDIRKYCICFGIFIAMYIFHSLAMIFEKKATHKSRGRYKFLITLELSLLGVFSLIYWLSGLTYFINKNVIINSFIIIPVSFGAYQYIQQIIFLRVQFGNRKQ